MAVADDNSRFQFTPAVSVDGVEALGAWVPPSFIAKRPRAEDIGTFYVQAAFAGRPDRIAHQVYGSRYLDWVIIAFNRASSQDVLNWPSAGDIIEYPLSPVVLREIN